MPDTLTYRLRGILFIGVINVVPSDRFAEQCEQGIDLPVTLEWVKSLAMTPSCRVVYAELVDISLYENTIRSKIFDQRVRIHRSTRARCFKRLRDLGLIEGDNRDITVVSPIDIFSGLSVKSNSNIDKNITTTHTEQPKNEQDQELENLLDKKIKSVQRNWDLYRPRKFNRCIKVTSKIVEAIDSHMEHLGLGESENDYEDFFSHLRSGIEANSFYMEVMKNKTLQAVVGFGPPDDRKFKAVYNLYYIGLENGPGKAETEEDRDERVKLPLSMKPLVEEFSEAQRCYAASLKIGQATQEQVDRIRSIQQIIRDKGYDSDLWRLHMPELADNWPGLSRGPIKDSHKLWVYVQD